MKDLIDIIERIKKKSEENPPNRPTFIYTVSNGNVYLDKIDEKNKIARWSWGEYKATLQVKNKKLYINSFHNIASRDGCSWCDMPTDVRHKMTSVTMAIMLKAHA